jgi:hypothetical protein
MPPPPSPDPALAEFMAHAGAQDYHDRFNSAPIGTWTNWQFIPSGVYRITFRADGTGELVSGNPMGICLMPGHRDELKTDGFSWKPIGERSLEIKVWDDFGFGPGKDGEPLESGILRYDFVESDQVASNVCILVPEQRSILMMRRDLIQLPPLEDKGDVPPIVQIPVNDKGKVSLGVAGRDCLYPPKARRVRMKVETEGFLWFLSPLDGAEHHDMLYLEQ